MPAAAVYVWLSTVDQHQDAAALASELHDTAQRLGYSVALDIHEKRRSGVDTRPGLRRILAAARRNEVDAVIAWKLNSLGATAAAVQQWVARFADAGTRVVLTSHGLDFRPGQSNVVGELLLPMLAAITEFESDRLRESTRLGIDRAREQGKQLGRPRVERPDTERVLKLRKRRKSWPAIAEELGVSLYAARTALPPGTDPMLDPPAPPTKKRRASHKAKPRRKRQRSPVRK
jgi:DNA invertase Pin-like site-specific DNA recombinase